MFFPDQKIIAFEGLDNSFKETNFKEFLKMLKQEFPENNIYSESFPRYGNQCTVGVEKWLNGSFDRSYLKAYPEAVNSMYSIDRLSYWYESVHGGTRNIENLNKVGSCFVFDRYNVSNAIYNPLVGGQTTVDDLQFDHYTFGIPQPDVVVWMRMRDFDVLKSLIAKKQGKDANEFDTEFIYQVWWRSENAIHSDIFERAGIKLIVIECLGVDGNIRSREELAADVWYRIQDYLDGLEF